MTTLVANQNIPWDIVFSICLWSAKRKQAYLLKTKSPELIPLDVNSEKATLLSAQRPERRDDFAQMQSEVVIKILLAFGKLYSLVFLMEIL